MKISIYFSLKEVEHSDTAVQNGVENICSPPALENARYTASRLDLIRHMIGLPFNVNSWFRGEKLNSLVGGSKTSAHVKGLAVDFYVKGNVSNVFKQITELQRQGKISFDQCYYKKSGNFIHIGFCRNLEDERNMSWTE